MIFRLLAWWVGMGWLLGCGGGSGATVGPRDAGADASGHDAGRRPLSAADPCSRTGFHFDGKSDCDVVRCHELTCECPTSVDAGAVSVSESLSFHGCVQGQGCIDNVDCKVACSASGRLERMACQTRLATPGAACSVDADCVTGHCRQESAGKFCVDMLGCGVDGHCSEGFTCRKPASAVDEQDALGFTATLGSCANGEYGSTCYEDSQCKYKLCSGNACAGGRVSDACKADEQCASGFCRIPEGSSAGSCVSGQIGSSCTDDSDCGEQLHCSAGTCYSSAVGQTCDEAGDCESGLCVSHVCRGGELGSVCLEGAHCKSGICFSARCVSGGPQSPCSTADDCRDQLRCARNVCSDGSAGSPCYVASDCSVRACVRGSCRTGENGQLCEAAEDCESSRCANPAGVEPGECTSGTQGSYCISNQNCVSASCSAQNICN